MNQTKNPAFISTVDRGVGTALRLLNVLGQAVGAIFELIGNFLAGLLDAIGNPLNSIPAVGKYLRGFFHWLGTILSSGFDLVAVLIGSLVNLLANGLGGTFRILAGALGSLFTQDGGLVRKGAVDILAGIAGAVIAIGGKLVALVHATFFMQMGERPLNEYEKAVIKRVFRNSLNMQNIRVIEGYAGLFSQNNRPFALGNRIYLKKIDTAQNPALFAHECCHIWQYQRYGVRYLIEALWAQWKVENAYSWEAEIARGHVRWQEFNREAQAQFVQDVYNGGRRKLSSNTIGEFYDDDPVSGEVEYKRKGVDHTALARETIKWIRNKGISG